VLADARDDAGNKAAKRLGAAASYVHADVTSTAQWTELIDGTLAAHGRVDVLVNNAAVLSRTDREDVRE
jgi:3alpha(or 20beta)-hydroxysteroid dehydrogenase